MELYNTLFKNYNPNDAYIFTPTIYPIAEEMRCEECGNLCDDFVEEEDGLICRSCHDVDIFADVDEYIPDPSLPPSILPIS